MKVPKNWNPRTLFAVMTIIL